MNLLFSLASSAAAIDVPLAWVIPFAVLLAAIALMPLINKHWWEHHYPKVAIALAVIPPIYYFLIVKTPSPWLAAMEEYVSFIILLAALYIISGGIVIRVNRKATPLANCGLLLIGAIVANIFGTTGASMLLIRPYLRMNRGHIKPYHIIFFIFVVSNAGGLLTPIGDPPLFLGYLQGVPFGWTLENLWLIWTIVVGLLLGVFLAIDTLDHRKMAREHVHEEGPQVHILGIQNFIFISMVLFAVFRPGVFEVMARLSQHGGEMQHLVDVVFSRELIMVLAVMLSLKMTPQEIYKHNVFEYGPIKEVAILFIGIFSTMAPALGWLEHNAEKLHVKSPAQFYFTTGTLSAVLDNAPTYLTFLQVRLSELAEDEVDQARQAIAEMQQSGKFVVPDRVTNGNVRADLTALLTNHPDRIQSRTLTENQLRLGFLLGVPELARFLIAISAGAVLFGACTYIGNGPNFMVKSIADSAGVRMPGFLGYVFKYSLPILIPTYLVVWLLFLRG